MRFINPSESLYAGAVPNPAPHQGICGPGYVWSPQYGKCVPGDPAGTIFAAMGQTQPSGAGLDTLVLSGRRAETAAMVRPSYPGRLANPDVCIKDSDCPSGYTCSSLGLCKPPDFAAPGAPPWSPAPRAQMVAPRGQRHVVGWKPPAAVSSNPAYRAAARRSAAAATTADPFATWQSAHVSPWGTVDPWANPAYRAVPRRPAAAATVDPFSTWQSSHVSPWGTVSPWG